MNILLFMILLNLIRSCFAQNILVDISQGTLAGSIKYDRKGKPFYSFQRIPYAKSPLGALRFKDPQPADSWTGVLDATIDLPECFQVLYNGTTFGQEDCLYLNVYTPELPSETFTPKSVMVFIHGGMFLDGSGSQDYYSPEFLIPADVVVVTINYRLNIFGFFNLEDASLGTPGNAGLKDQTLALKWLQQNIESFGGNSSEVTLLGHSVGGVSAELHMLSPLSKGLFSKVIMQSGVAICPWVVGKPNSGILLAQYLGLSTENQEEMLDVLQSLSTEQIFAGFQLLESNVPMRWGFIQQPIVEKQTDGTAFLVGDIMTLIRAGNYDPVPIMIGYTDAEGILYDQLLRNLTGASIPITDFFTYVPGDINVEPGTQQAADLAQEVKTFYHGDDEPTVDNMQPFIEINRDVNFAFPSRRAAVEHVKTNNGKPIYFYRFSADTKMNVYKRRDEVSASYPGASHADDLGYIFKTFITPSVKEGSIEDKAIDRVVKVFANFAKYGNPTPTNEGLVWQPVQEDVLNFVDIGSTENVAGVDPDPVNMNFWLDIYDRFYQL